MHDTHCMELAYLSLGSNIGDREAALREAIQRLAAIGRVELVSSIYETEPVEVTDQPWFLNCAVAMETEKTPEQLLSEILSIEEEMGRRRVQEKGPRNIDVDILLYGGAVVESPSLTIPHPAMQQRRFVLEPLAEIAPEARNHGSGRSVREMLEALPPGQAVRKITKS
ncbi:MAG: 2-amino-4-hydroxy-6-hydroxymethyldihydropteridine diphosphokinase [Candidatus Sulfotelmatobacter sp.]